MTIRETILAQKGAGETITPKYLDGQAVRVAVMSVGERRDFLKASNDENGEQDSALLEAAIVVECLRDPETGEHVFGAADIEALVNLPALVLDELAEPCLRVNGLAVGSVDAALKN